MAAGAGVTLPPLRLKDLLELDCDSCSAAGFRCYPRRLGESAPAPMRHLLESSSPSSSMRRHHRRTSSKLSHLSRSLSRRLSIRRSGGFWSSRRREDEEDEDAVAVATAGSGCGSRSSEEMETSSSSESSDNSCGRTNRRSRSESDSDDFSSATEDSVHHHPSQQATGAGDEHEVVPMKRVVSKEGSSSGSEADDKEQEQEQLSPVAVMDFPFDDDEDDELRDAAVACSPPSFSLERLQRRNTHKIRRFGSRDDELAPLDLEARLAATSDPAAVPPQQLQQQMMIQCRPEDAATPTCAGSNVHDMPHDDDDLISLLMGTPVSVGLDDASERLLLDLFVEMMKRRHSESEAHAEADLLLLPLPNGTAPAAGGVLRRKAERIVDDDEAAVAAAARDWLEGTGTERWGLTDVLSGGAAIVAEMERGRRWMQVGEEEREVGAIVAGMLLDQLVAEVVRCLFV